MRILLRVAYDGTKFHGSARQPDLRTVEGEVEFVLRKIGAIQDIPSSRFLFASRTDAGVSALGNAVAVTTGFPPEGLVGAFNHEASYVFATGFAAVPEDFDPRHAQARWYRYHLPEVKDIEPWRRYTRLFIGEHDFASFTRDTGETVRRVESVEVERVEGMAVLDVRATGFLWNMIRRLVSALSALASGDAVEAEVSAALRGEVQIDLGTARPEPLTLMAVEYPFSFLGGLDTATRERLLRRLQDARIRSKWLSDLANRGGPNGD